MWLLRLIFEEEITSVVAVATVGTAAAASLETADPEAVAATDAYRMK